MPEDIITDRGPQFASEMMHKLNKLLGIETKLSTAFHPQTDRQTERTNQEVEQFLRLFVNQCQDDWPEWLSIAEFMHNNTIHLAMQVLPFFATYGTHPRMGFEPRRQSKNESANDFATQMQKVHKELQAALSKAQEEMKRFAGQKRGDTLEYEVGQKVWRETDNLKLTRPSRKLMEKRIGPYEIVELVGENAVKLKLPESLPIHPVVNVSRVRPYKAPKIPRQIVEPPPPMEIEGDLEYKVEEILDSRIYRGKFQYLVKWKGYTAEHNTWEPVSNVENTKDAVKQFHPSYPLAPQRIRFTSSEDFTKLFRPWENYTTTPQGSTSCLNIDDKDTKM